MQNTQKPQILDQEQIQKPLQQSSLKLDIIRILTQQKNGNKLVFSEKSKKIKRTRMKRSNLNEKQLMSLINKFKENQAALKSVVKQKKYINKIASQLNCCPRTIYKIYQDYLFDNTLTNKFIICRKAKKYQRNPFCQKRLSALKQMLDLNPFLKTPEMVDKLNEIDDLRKGNKLITKKQVRRLLVLMQYHRRRISKHTEDRNSVEVVQQRHEYCVLYQNLNNKKLKIFFLGDIRLNRYSMREMVWTTKKTIIKDNNDFNIGDNASLISIISENGLQQYEIKIGNYSSEDYLIFLNKFIQKIQQKEKSQVVYLAVQLTKLAKQAVGGQVKYIRSERVQLINFPANSPQLNPIECWFYQFKPKVRRINLLNNDDLLKEIELNVGKYKYGDFKEFYERAEMHIVRGIQNQPF